MTENSIEYCVKAVSMVYVFNYNVYHIYMCKIQHEMYLVTVSWVTDDALIVY